MGGEAARLVISPVRVVELEPDLPPADRAAAAELLAQGIAAAEVEEGVAIQDGRGLGLGRGLG